MSYAIETYDLAYRVGKHFEIRELDNFCRKLQAKGFYVTQMPRMMPWGWRHAYLNDPDGHELSLYWAGEIRMKKTMMKVARAIEKAPRAQSGSEVHR